MNPMSLMIGVFVGVGALLAADYLVWSGGLIGPAPVTEGMVKRI